MSREQIAAVKMGSILPPGTFLVICCLFGEEVGLVSSSKELVENLHMVIVKSGAPGLIMVFDFH